MDRRYLLVLLCVLVSCGPRQREVSLTTPLEASLRRFAPTGISANLSHLSAGDRAAAGKLIEASRLMDEIFLRQVWAGNTGLLARLQADQSAEGKLRLRYFRMNFGPWSRLDNNEPFVAGVPPKPPGANFYPDGMTREEFNTWAGTLPGPAAVQATGNFHVIRRDGTGKLRTVPYDEEYREFLDPAAALLREAAAATDNASLKKYLSLRAEAFLSNDYFVSDLAWMDLDSPLEVTIGPYETYEDELFGYKAAFESFIAVRIPEESARLARLSGHLQEIENHLPLEPRYRNPKLGPAAPIVVADEIFVGGEARSGVQTAAFNLPNDERVIRARGSKRVMLKNVQRAKFEKTLVPIARQVLESGQLPALSFDAFFTHTLAHELMHGLGPHDIRAAGRSSTVRRELKELYAGLEEAKADAAGLFALQYLIDKGVIERGLEAPLYITFLASAFRSVRFGINEAHGKAVALQFNYLRDAGAIRPVEGSVKFGVDPGRIKGAVRNLTRELLTVEAEGSYDKARKMLDTLGVIRPEMRQALDALGSVPVDIEPVLSGAKQ